MPLAVPLSLTSTHLFPDCGFVRSCLAFRRNCWDPEPLHVVQMMSAPLAPEPFLTVMHLSCDRTVPPTNFQRCQETLAQSQISSADPDAAPGLPTMPMHRPESWL